MSLTDSTSLSAPERPALPYISDILDEKAQTAVDNETAQILGRVGLSNMSAFSVDVYLRLQSISNEILPLATDVKDVNK